jgi:hypothetical protein
MPLPPWLKHLVTNMFMPEEAAFGHMFCQKCRLGGGLVGGKFGGIHFRSRLVLLLRAVEFEDAVDVDLGDPMLDVHRRFFRGVLCLVLAVTQLTFDLHVSPFLELRRELGERSPGHAAMPIGPGVTAAPGVSPRGLGGDGKHRRRCALVC